jgi:predicted regulator of Ras-like GTPase activity (Roadblock/LC7/MglB family)
MATLVPQEFNAEWGGALLGLLNRRAEALLREMEKVPGVQSAFVCDARGTALVLWYITPLDRETASRVGVSVVNLMNAFSGHTFDEIDLRFEDRLVYARTLGNAFLVVVSAREVNRALLRMTCNVAAAPFLADKELQRNLSPTTRLDIGMRFGMGGGFN